MYPEPWHVFSDIKSDAFDWNWKPPKWDPPYIYAWGNKWVPAEEKPTIEYRVPGATQYKYMPEQVEIVIDMFWIDTGNNNTEEYLRLQKSFPLIKKTRFANSWLETITRCAKKSTTKFCWILSSELDYKNFDFNYYPDKGQTEMVHIFGHQWSNWGNTYFINSHTFLENTKNITKISSINNVHLSNHTQAKTICLGHSILLINFGNASFKMPSVCNQIYTTDWCGSYLNTINNWILKNSDKVASNYLWVISSICDYTKFDFSFLPDCFTEEALHVFASSSSGIQQKFGDTFLINTISWHKNATNLINLEDYSGGINYIPNLAIERLQHPVLKHCYSSHVDALSLLDGTNFPYSMLLASNGVSNNYKVQPPNLWCQEKFILTTWGAGNQQAIVPKNICTKIKKELWDYPHIKCMGGTIGGIPLDIMFISNGEPLAEENYESLKKLLISYGVQNRLVWIKNVSGRVESQHAAANASNTDWYFLVNGKIRVGNNFDWGWQPDRLQAKKHYIFKVHNPVNGLYYGHQAIVANNKNLTLSTQVSGLDFTMDSIHAVVDMDCGIAVYNSDPWTAWRTAFREAIKLRCNSDPESVERLGAWLSSGTGLNADWSQRGAIDGVQYWQSVDGRLPDLMLSYDWGWIHKYYVNKYGE